MIFHSRTHGVVFPLLIAAALLASPRWVDAQQGQLPTIRDASPAPERSIYESYYVDGPASPGAVGGGVRMTDQLGYVDLDAQLGPPSSPPPAGCNTGGYACCEPWSFQILPDGLVYSPYLASTKESRFSLHYYSGTNDNTLWDASLGTRIALLRWGSSDPVRPVGWELEAEGSAQLRLDMGEMRDVRSTDYRAGVQLARSTGRHQTRFGYYHLSSHLGDEFLLKNPGFDRLNYSRDVLMLGHQVYLTDSLKVYAEAGWSFYTFVGKPWEFQFGIDWSPAHPTGLRGAPFMALNVHLREEVNFGGGFTAQVGWAWRADQSSKMLRTGFHYYNGESNQYSFFDYHEEQIGFGLWYDF